MATTPTTHPTSSSLELPDSEPSSSLAASLPSELVTEIVNHLPLVCLPAAMMSLALTCHHLCNIIIPEMLYHAVWLEGEERALYTLTRFNTRLREGSQISRHIRYLRVAFSQRRSLQESSTNVLQELRILVSAGGLCNVVAFTLHQEDRWLWTQEVLKEIDKLSHALANNCPSITSIHLTGSNDYITVWTAITRAFASKVELSQSYLDRPARVDVWFQSFRL